MARDLVMGIAEQFVSEHTYVENDVPSEDAHVMRERLTGAVYSYLLDDDHERLTWKLHRWALTFGVEFDSEADVALRGHCDMIAGFRDMLAPVGKVPRA